MNFTGKNLRLVHDAIIEAIAELRNQVATCPDVEEYAEDLEEIEATQTQYEKLFDRVKKALEKEGAK